MVVTSHLADLPVPFLTPAFWWVGRSMIVEDGKLGKVVGC